MKTLAETRDRVFFYRAKRLAKHSDYPTYRVGAFAAHNNKALAGGFNTIRNDPTGRHDRTMFGNATYHAEYNCLRAVPERLLSRITLYVARIDKAGRLRPSRPCPSCRSVIDSYGVREVVYWNGEFIIKEVLPWT